MDSDPYVWIFHPQYGLHYRYDERKDQIVYENGFISPRPTNISGDYLLAHKRAILATDPHVPRTALHYPAVYKAEQDGAFASPVSTYVLANARPSYPPPNMTMTTDTGSTTTARHMRDSGVLVDRSLPPSSPEALTRQMNSMSLNDAGRRLSYHAPVSQISQSSQTSMMQIYTTPAGILRTQPPVVEPLPEKDAKLYSSFKKKMKTRKFFVIGKVFLTLWTEPAGDMGSNYTAITSGYSVGAFGEGIYSKIRRFVVVREGEQSCTAVPILTYQHQGVGKAGVTKSEHAIIYTGRDAPEAHRTERARRGEDPMLLPIRVDADDPAEKLDPWSRIHFGKVYSIEHNVKVRSLGKVNSTSMTALLYQFRAVWERNFGGQGSQLQIKTPQGVRTATVETSDSPQQADLTGMINKLIAQGHTIEQIKQVLSVGFQLPSAGEPAISVQNQDPRDEQDKEGQAGDDENTHHNVSSSGA